MSAPSGWRTSRAWPLARTSSSGCERRSANGYRSTSSRRCCSSAGSRATVATRRIEPAERPSRITHVSARSRTERRASAVSVASSSSTASNAALASARKAARCSRRSRSASARARSVTSRATTTIRCPPADLERHGGDLHRDPVAVAVADRDLIAVIGPALQPQLRALAEVRALLLDHEIVDRRQRLQLIGRVAGDRQEGGIRVLEPAVAGEHDHRLADLRQGEQQRLVARRLLLCRTLGGAPLGDLEHDGPDADDAVVVAAAHRPVGDDALPVHAGRGGGGARRPRAR